jgi:hypothetical protein
VTVARDWTDVAIVILTALLVIVGGVTGYAIWRQAVLTGRSVALQEAALEQWLLFRRWKTTITHRDDGTTLMRVEFKIVNPTKFPLTIRFISVKIRQQNVSIADRYHLAPGKARGYEVPIKLQPGDPEQMRDNALILVVTGYVTFIGSLKNEVEWPLTGILVCTENVASFRAEHIAPDKEKDGEKAN